MARPAKQQWTPSPRVFGCSVTGPPFALPLERFYPGFLEYLNHPRSAACIHPRANNDSPSGITGSAVSPSLPVKTHSTKG